MTTAALAEPLTGRRIKTYTTYGATELSRHVADQLQSGEITPDQAAAIITNRPAGATTGAPINTRAAAIAEIVADLEKTHEWAQAQIAAGNPDLTTGHLERIMDEVARLTDRYDYENWVQS